MKVPFSFSMAMKYLKPKRSLVSVVTVISMVGVALGEISFRDANEEGLVRVAAFVKTVAISQQLLECLPWEEMPQPIHCKSTNAIDEAT